MSDERATSQLAAWELDLAPDGFGLRAAMDEISAQPGARTLARALTLADGFQFALVACTSVRAAAATQQWLLEILPSELGPGVSVQRVSPYPLDLRVAGPATLEPAELVEWVFSQLLPEPSSEAAEPRVVLLDSSRAHAASRPAWHRLFARLNEHRNLLMRELGGSLTLFLPSSLFAEFAQAAPDLWSIRSLSVDIDEPETALPRGRMMIEAHDAGLEAAEDPESLHLEVNRLRAQASGGSPTARRALCMLLLRMASAYRRRGRLDESLTHIDEAEVIAETLDERAVLAACWIARSEVLEIRGLLDEAREHLEHAHAALESDEWAQADTKGRIADILYTRGELDEALRILQDEQLPIYERLGDVRERAIAVGKIADIFYARGELDEALRIRREEQLPVFERLGDVRERAVTMGRVADILYARGELDEALRIRRDEQLPIYGRLGDVHSLAVTMGRVADILARRGQLDEALRIHRDEELPIYERLGAVREHAVAMGKVADILETRGQLDEALRIRQDQELPVYEQLGDVRSRAGTKFKIARLLANQGQPEGAQMVSTFLRSALADARALSIPEVKAVEHFIRQLGGDPDAPPFSSPEQ